MLVGGVGGSTGVARFDELMVGTRRFARWKQAVEKRGFKVTVRGTGEMSPIEMSEDTAAEIQPLAPKAPEDLPYRYELVINAEIFRYIDLLHEGRHIQQITRAEKAGVKHLFTTALIIAAERDAWLMEKELSERYGFAQSYLAFVEERLRDYSVRDGFARKYRRDPNLQKFVALLKSFHW